MAKKRGTRSQQILTQKLLREQRDAFIKKFGREPRPGDPIFFDPGKDVPTSLTERSVNDEVLEGMKLAGVPPHLIYAYEQTGLILMQGVDYPEAVRKEYQDAVEKYFYLKDIGKLPPDH